MNARGSHSAFEVDLGRMVRLLATSAAGWVPTMIGLCLLGFGAIPFAVGVGLGLAGALATSLVIAMRTIKRRRPPVAVGDDAAPPHSLTWAQVADPRENYANRWAMYEDLSAWLLQQDWSDKLVAEFGDTNAILRRFLRGGEYRLLSYPEYDVQNLHNVAGGAFDLVILDQTLEHLRDPERALTEVQRTLKPGGLAIVTTPFLVPVHRGNDYGDYYRWTPEGLAAALQRSGFDAELRMWGNRRAAAALMEDMYMSAEEALRRGLGISLRHTEADFPVTVWAIATARQS